MLTRRTVSVKNLLNRRGEMISSHLGDRFTQTFIHDDLEPPTAHPAHGAGQLGQQETAEKTACKEKERIRQPSDARRFDN